jgi:hypothetical protein
MKQKLIITFAILSMFFVACQKTELNETLNSKEISVDSTTIVDTYGNNEFVQSNFGGPESLLKRKQIRIKDLSAEIITFLKEQYDGYTIVRAYQDERGDTHVIVRGAEGILKVVSFTRDGVFIKEETLNVKAGGDDTAIKSIRAYIAENYPGATVVRTWRGKDGNINVRVKTAEGNTIVLTFDKTGKFIKVTEPKIDVPSDTTVFLNIKTYLNKTYPGASVGEITKTRDGGYRVEVTLSNGKTIIVFFDRRGKFVKTGR